MWPFKYKNIYILKKNRVASYPGSSPAEKWGEILQGRSLQLGMGQKKKSTFACVTKFCRSTHITCAKEHSFC